MDAIDVRKPGASDAKELLSRWLVFVMICTDEAASHQGEYISGMLDMGRMVSNACHFSQQPLALQETPANTV